MSGRGSRSYTASFSSLAGRNATFLLALILMASPVAGFRPIRGRPLPHLEDAEAGQADFVALLQMAGGQRHQIAQHGLSLLLRDVMAVRQCGGEMLECDGSLGRSFRWAAAFFAAAFLAVVTGMGFLAVLA